MSHNQNFFIKCDHKHIHFHCIRGITSCDLAHRHLFEGRTDFAFSGEGHVHYYSLYTSFNNGHSHLIFGYTGPAIFLPNGRHYHLFNGRTTCDGQVPHTHDYVGATST